MTRRRAARLTPPPLPTPPPLLLPPRYKQTKEYTDNKRTFSFSGEPVLSDIPQLTALYKENDEKTAKLEAFIHKCEVALAGYLSGGEVPPVALADAIAVCKVQCVEDSIAMTFRLKQEVGRCVISGGGGRKRKGFDDDI